MKHACALLTSIALCLSGCSSTKVEDYEGRGPKLDIRNYLNGELEATGIFIDRKGDADPRFHVKMRGEWHGNNGTLTEHFTYSDGRKEQRIWTIVFQDDHHFTGTAHDIVGTAQGKQYGNAANLQYILSVKVKEKTYNMNMDDWMYLVDDKTLINRTEMHKFGIKVGELVISFHKK